MLLRWQKAMMQALDNNIPAREIISALRDDISYLEATELLPSGECTWLQKWEQLLQQRDE